MVLGKGAPTSPFIPEGGTYAAYKGGGMTATLHVLLTQPLGTSDSVVYPVSVSPKDGSFKFPSVLPFSYNPNPHQVVIKRQPFSSMAKKSVVRITLQVHGHPIYRSGYFAGELASKEPIDIFLYQPSLPKNVGITAGQISTALADSGLPASVPLGTNSSGIGVAGSQSGVDIQLTVELVPDTSENLSVYIGLALSNWNIHVGFPADCVTNADDVLSGIKAKLAQGDSKANQMVSSVITSTLEQVEKLTPQEAQRLLEGASFQFISFAYPSSYKWSASDTSDKTTVVTPRIALGYPRLMYSLPLRAPKAAQLGPMRRANIHLPDPGRYGMGRRGRPGTMRPIKMTRVPPPRRSRRNR